MIGLDIEIIEIYSDIKTHSLQVSTTHAYLCLYIRLKIHKEKLKSHQSIFGILDKTI